MRYQGRGMRRVEIFRSWVRLMGQEIDLLASKIISDNSYVRAQLPA
jgi:hypothetical protein